MTGFRWFTEYGYSGFAAHGAYTMLKVRRRVGLGAGGARPK